MKPKIFKASRLAIPENWRKISLSAILFCLCLGVNAQSTDKFFGMNYWEYADYNGVTTDKFKDLMPETGSWNLKMIRIGGNYSNMNKNQSGDKDWYVNAIVNAKAIGGTPLVQLPINLPSTDVAAWMDYFNVTKNLGVVYWGIGNEPDPSSGYDTWFAGTTTADGNTYAQFRSKFKAIAKAIKAKDANSIICGPDFRHWWGSVDNAGTPFGGWYKDFLYGAGANAVGTDSYNGDQLVDIFAFHFYGDGGSGNFDEGEISAKYAEMMKLIDATNALRPAAQPIKIAVGEYNDNYNYTGFRVGQRMAIMAKQSLKNNAVYLTPWSLCEGNSWAMIDKSTGTFYSAAHHWKMLSQNQRGNYMNSEVNDNHAYDIVPLGMKDGNGYTIVLVNEGGTDYTFSVKFSTTAGNYSAATAAIKFRFDANVNIDFANLTLYKNSTLLFTFDAAGNMLKKMDYRSGYTAPVTTTYNVNAAPSVGFSAPVNGATFEAGTNVQITASASDTDGTIAKVEFYDGAATTPFHTENIAPYDFIWNAFSVGSHTITAKAYDNNGATSTATRSITIVNTAPTVSITSPANGTSVAAGTAITLTATAADTAPGTIASVSFYDGTNTTPIATVTTSPYSATWTGATAGTHSITAKATDNNGSVTTSAAVSITVTAVNAAPTVSFSSPSAGSTFEAGADVQVTALASDSDGTIAKVEFYDGAATTPFHTENLAPYDFAWNAFSVGSRTITAKAYDDSGATSTATRSITIVNTAPTVSITSPTNGTSTAAGTIIILTATAGDTAPGSITSVSFYDGTNTSPIATVTTSPYTANWTGATVGTHSITAKATDNNGSVTTSAAVSITVTLSSDPMTQSYYHVVDKWTADYMRPTGGSSTATIIQEESATTPTLSSFQWELRAAPTNGYYFIVNKYTGNAIQPTGGSNADGVGLSQIALTTANQNNTALHWAFEASGEANYYWIKNRYSGKYIRPDAGTDGTGVAIVQNTLNTTYSSFKWSLMNPVAKSARSAAVVSSETEATTTTIYPNPADHVVTVVTEVEHQTTVSVSIYNVLGRQVLVKDFENISGHFEKSFDVSDFSSGAFILKVKKGSNTESKRFIKN